jgi:class 3 adenylate cyclase
MHVVLVTARTAWARLGPEEVPVGERARRGDEMRPITALFADIVGSTALGERLGPDEVKALVGEFVTRMGRAVEELGGVVQAYMGDGICAYFGVPTAHEDDPERAARAALRIVGMATAYAAEAEAAWGVSGFDVRVGLNSGPAAVGVVGGAFEQTVALGDTTNVAARLQSAAEPGSIAAGEGTAQRLRDQFLLEPLGPLSLKGRGEPVAAWRVVGTRSVAEPRPLTPFVGREGELERLREVTRDLEAGRGQVLLVLGEAGLGKSRMLAELRSLVGDRAAWTDGRCSSYGAEVPYGPFVEILWTWLGLEQGSPELAVRTKLRARIGALLDDGHELLPYLALVLGIRLDPSTERELLPLSASELAKRIRGAYVAWVEALAAQRPLVVAVDDLQWVDHPTHELADDLLALTDRTPVLIALALRPDSASEAWELRTRASAEFAHRTTEVPLAPLDEAASRELVEGVLPPGVLGRRLRDEIVARAEGNPLYLEELLRAVLEAGGTQRHRTWTVAPDSVTDLPPALEALLVARIDRLPPVSGRLAQVAAVIGRTFPVVVLERVKGKDATEEGLPVLLRSGIVRELRRYPELECTFGHGLLQEAALSTLTLATLRHLNGLVGEALEEQYPLRREEMAERLAFHFYRSDEPARALPYLEIAADRAAEPAQAEELWGRAARLADRLGDEAAKRRIAYRLDARQAD